MNKKILFLILLGAILIPSAFVFANGSAGGNTTLPGMLGEVKKSAIALGEGIIIIGWIVAGILYLTAAGDPTKLGIAKKALIACVIGTVLVILAIGSGPVMGVIRNAFGLPAQ